MSRKTIRGAVCACFTFIISSLASAPATGSWAQTATTPKAAVSPAPKAPPADDEDDDLPTVNVIGHKLPPQPGAVVGDIKPELQLSPADVQSYGVSTVTELLEELAPETRSDRGRGGETPVVLLNGRRISSMNEIQNIPTEAIQRVDILPEEVSLKYGYTADQRVVNIVLRRRFRAITGELVGGETTEGGHETGQGEVDLLHLRGDSRLNLDLKYQAAAALTEVQRDLNSNVSGTPFDLTGNITAPTAGAQIDPPLSALVGQPVTVAGVPMGAGDRALPLSDFVPTAGVPNVTNVGRDRTLLPATQQVTANGVFSTPIFWGLTATVNGTFSATDSNALQGLSGLSLLVPEGDPFSPFGSDVLLARYASGTPLRQSVDGWTAHLGSTLNRDFGDWRLSLTNAYDHADTQTVSDTGVNPAPLQTLLNQGSNSFNPFGTLPSNLLTQLPQNSARSITDAANLQFLVNGPLLKVPAGNLYVSAKIGDNESLLNSHSTGYDGLQSVSLSRNDANAQLNLDLPLASVSHHFLPWFGELSVNLNTAVDDLSDLGVLNTLGYGVNWTPVTGVNLIVSHTNDHAAPTTLQLGGAVVSTPGVRLFDYATGQTVEVTQVTGGADKLTADNRNVLKIGLTLKPFPTENLTITANYIKVRLDNPIETFPSASAAIEAAFPDRFIRDAGDDLIEEDDRPVNFARQDRQELRWGLNYSRPIGPQPPPRPIRGFRRPGQGGARRPGDGAAGGTPNDQGASNSGDAAEPGTAPTSTDATNRAAPSQTPDGGARSRGSGGGGGGAGRFGGGGGFAGGGRLQFAVYHTIFFQDQFLVRQGGPVLDLLNGAAAGATGGQPRQEIEAQLGFTLYGFGARLSADLKSGTTMKGGSGAPTDNLTFSDIGTINLRLFDNLGQQRSVVHDYPWLRGARVTLSVTNLFDQRIDVRDGTGMTPLNYQSAYLDPTGRTISLSLRKLFY